MQIVCRDGSELNFSIWASCRSPKLADLMVVSDKKACGLYSVRAYHTGTCNMNRVSAEYFITKPRFLATIVALLEIRESVFSLNGFYINNNNAVIVDSLFSRISSLDINDIPFMPIVYSKSFFFQLSLKGSRTLQWHHNELHDVSNHHQPHDCLLNRLFRRRKQQSSASLTFVRGINP